MIRYFSLKRGVVLNELYKQITLTENILLLCLKGSNFYNVCLEYNLNNLEEIFTFFNNNDIVKKNERSYMEIHGLVNILKYFYLHENIPIWSKLYKKTVSSKCNKGDKSDYLYNKYYNLFRSLGFSSSEAFELCYELEYCDKIGNAILRLYYKKINSNKKNTNQEHYIFFKKLEILVSYYLKNDNIHLLSDDVVLLKKQTYCKVY